jgi:hypothetical protein
MRSINRVQQLSSAKMNANHHLIEGICYSMYGVGSILLTPLPLPPILSSTSVGPASDCGCCVRSTGLGIIIRSNPGVLLVFAAGTFP